MRLFLNVGQLLKQRCLEPGLQTVGSLSKCDGDKRDPKNNRFKLAKQQLNLHVHHVFLSLAVVARLRLQMSTSYAGSKQQTTIFFSFFLLKTSLLEFISRKIAIISKLERGGIKAMWLSIHSHMLVLCKILPALNFGELWLYFLSGNHWEKVFLIFFSPNSLPGYAN